MLNGAALVQRVGVRRMVASAIVILGLAAPSAASATITSVFSGKVTCETKLSGAETGQRWCGNASNTTVPTWDGTTPIDVSVAFPPAAGPDNNYPVVGIYHGWGGSKITPSSAQAQRWLKLGYAVFSMSDRGWGYSCGVYNKTLATCKSAGYIHLLSRRYEVRDAQFLLGELADEGDINPQQIGANGGSYGGGMSLQLGSLKDRVELTNGTLIPWTSPGGKPMKIAATAPEYPWSDLAQALQPNGSNLDYVTEAPYSGLLGNHEYGIEKQNWNETLYNAGALLGYYEATPEEPEAALTEWHTFNGTGGPYYEIVGGKAKSKPLAEEQENQLPYHGAYYTNLSEAPAPALIENGWNDDLFTVNESVDYYNKVRASYPSQPIQLFYFDYGHNPRSATSPSTAESAAFATAQNEWFAHYIKGEGAEPANAEGGVTAITSACTAETTATGTTFTAANWASLAAGEVNLQGAAEQTIAAPGTAPKTAFTSGTVCTTEAAGENASAATYKLAAAPSGGYTIAGSPTVIAELSTPIRNDQVIARLMDEEPSGKQRLIGRAIYRPINPEGGFTTQAFQLHPQAWKVEAGHVLKLQLLIQDSKYARTSSSTSTSAASIKVKSLELRIPTIDAPGSAGGLVESPRAKYLPADYTLARNVTPAAPGAPALTSGSSPNNTGVFTLGWAASQSASALTYTLQAKNNGGTWATVASGLSSPEYAFTSGSPEGEGTWSYRVSASNEGPASGYSGESSAVKVDETAPSAPTATTSRPAEYAGGGGWFKGSVEVSFAANGDPALSDGSAGSGVNLATLSPAVTVSATEKVCGTVADNAGNVSAPGCITVQVDNTPPSLEINCPATAELNSSASATFTASDGQSGLASEASGSVPINTSVPGEATASTTAVDNVGNETTKSCHTEIVYPAAGAPALSAGSTPNNMGLFTLSWTGPNPMDYLDLSYTLQHRSHDTGWTNVASEIDSLSYQFTGAGESEGTWEYRVEGVDSVNSLNTGWSGESSPVVVDETAPSAPTATTSRPAEYAGGGGWFKGSVEVSFAANGDPNLADGSAGSGVNLATLSPAVTASSTEKVCGTVADNAGNVSAPGCITVQVDNTPPSLEINCPATAEVGSSAEATFNASDAQSGLASAASGTVPINTSTAGEKTVSTTAFDNVGNQVTESCSTEVGYPTPGAPHLSAGSTPNNTGDFTLSWTGANPMDYLDLSYTLQHRSHDTGWTTVASEIDSLSYQFTGAGEHEGTWEYRVEGVDSVNSLNTGWSGGSSPVVVDETAPHAPSALATRAPDYAGGGGWYKNSAEVEFVSNGDPPLADTSPGSGVNPASLPATQVFSTSGSHQACGSVTDYAGNVSGKGCKTVQVDATPPTLGITCPASTVLGTAGVKATVTASDAYSGLASNPSGTVAITTTAVGNQVITRTATSNVGLSTTTSCTTDVVYAFAFKGFPESEYYPSHTILIAITLKNSKAQAQAGAGPTVEIAPVVHGVTGTYVPATSPLSQFSGDKFNEVTPKGEYKYDLTGPKTGGTYSVRVAPGDGSTHAVNIFIN